MHLLTAAPEKPSYGVDDGGKKTKFFSQDAKARMVDVRTKCVPTKAAASSRQPSFGVDDDRRKAEFCVQHKMSWSGSNKRPARPSSSSPELENKIKRARGEPGGAVVAGTTLHDVGT